MYCGLNAEEVEEAGDTICGTFESTDCPGCIAGFEAATQVSQVRRESGRGRAFLQVDVSEEIRTTLEDLRGIVNELTARDQAALELLHREMGELRQENERLKDQVSILSMGFAKAWVSQHPTSPNASPWRKAIGAYFQKRARIIPVIEDGQFHIKAIELEEQDDRPRSVWERLGDDDG